jgi:hypothetical protein
MSIFNYKKFLSEEYPEISMYQDCFGCNSQIEEEHFYKNDLRRYKTLEYNPGNTMSDAEADLFQRLVFASTAIDDYRFEFEGVSLLPDFSFCVNQQDGRYFKVASITKEQLKKLFTTLLRSQMNTHTCLHCGVELDVVEQCIRKKENLYKRRRKEYREKFKSQIINAIEHDSNSS